MMSKGKHSVGHVVRAMPPMSSGSAVTSVRTGSMGSV